MSYIILLLRNFPYFVSAHRVSNIHVLRPVLFHFHVFLRPSLRLIFGLPVFQCPPTSIFHVLTIYSSVFLSTWPNHVSLHSLFYVLTYVCHTCHFALISSFLIFSILFMPIIHINILVSVLSSKFCSAFLTAMSRVNTLEHV